MSFNTAAQSQSNMTIHIDADLTPYQTKLIDIQIEQSKVFMQDLGLSSQYPKKAKLLIVSNYLHFISIQERLWNETISHSAFYDVESQQMVIYYDKDTQTLLQRVRHESIHMLLKNQYPNTPLWFHEGLAEFYEHHNDQPVTSNSTIGNQSSITFQQLLDTLYGQRELDELYFRQALQTITFLYKNRYQPEIAEVIHASLNNTTASTHSIQAANRRWLAK
jgi:hypothetical protein